VRTEGKGRGRAAACVCQKVCQIKTKFIDIRSFVIFWTKAEDLNMEILIKKSNFEDFKIVRQVFQSC
jgi:hypothetical protein